MTWLRSLHPQPVIVKPEGPTLDTDMLILMGVSALSFTLLFLGLFMMRYAVARLEHAAERRAMSAVAEAT